MKIAKIIAIAAIATGRKLPGQQRNVGLLD